MENDIMETGCGDISGSQCGGEVSGASAAETTGTKVPGTKVPETKVSGETVSGDSADGSLAAENLRLRGELACARLGVPGEIAGDIIAAALGGCSAGNGRFAEGEFEAAVKSVYERISGAIGKSSVRGISTGVRSEKGTGVSDQALRRAFGLRDS